MFFVRGFFVFVCVFVCIVNVGDVAFGMQVEVHVKADRDPFAITVRGSDLREGFHSPGVPGGHVDFRITGGSGKSGSAVRSRCQMLTLPAASPATPAIVVARVVRTLSQLAPMLRKPAVAGTISILGTGMVADEVAERSNERVIKGLLKQLEIQHMVTEMFKDGTVKKQLDEQYAGGKITKEEYDRAAAAIPEAQYQSTVKEQEIIQTVTERNMEALKPSHLLMDETDVIVSLVVQALDQTVIEGTKRLLSVLVAQSFELSGYPIYPRKNQHCDSPKPEKRDKLQTGFEMPYEDLPVGERFGVCDPVHFEVSYRKTLFSDLREKQYCGGVLSDATKHFRIMKWSDIRTMSDKQRSLIYLNLGDNMANYSVAESFIAAAVMDPPDYVEDEQPVVSIAGQPEIDGVTLAYKADFVSNTSTIFSTGPTSIKSPLDWFFVEVLDSDDKLRGVIPVNITITDHPPTCETARQRLEDRYGASEDGPMATDGIFSSANQGNAVKKGDIYVERGSQIDTSSAHCFDSDFDELQESTKTTGSISKITSSKGDSNLIQVPGDKLGSVGEITFEAEDQSDLKSTSEVIPVLTKDVPFVCKAVKGRLVVRVKPGEEKRVDVPCGLKNDVKPIAKVSGSGGVFEDRNGTFKVDVDQGSGGVSLVVGVNAGVVGQFTRQVTLLNGDLRTVLPVDVVVDIDGSNGGGGGSSSGGGGKYAPPVVDSPGPKPSLPSSESGQMSSGRSASED